MLKSDGEKYRNLHCRCDCLPRGVHGGAVQPEEEQAAAHRQPWQEDHHRCWMVSTLLALIHHMNRMLVRLLALV